MITIVPYLGSETRIFDALLKISGCDAGLSTELVADPTTGVLNLLEVRFEPQGQPSFSSGRLQEIVESDRDAYVYGVDDSFITPWGQPMVTYGGATAVDLETSKDVCSVYVDVTDAAGLGYRSLDRNGNYIYAPLAVILFHELAHVYHAMIADDTPGDEPRDQLLAISDENQFRAQLGFPLRNPNVTAHDITGPPTVGPTTLTGCNDATAWSLDNLCKNY